jgi:universal stress protein A
MHSVKRILVPVDYSDVSRAALSAAIQLADRNAAEVFTLHVQKNLDKALQRRIITNPHESVLEKGIQADEMALMQAIELEYQRCENEGTYLQHVPIHIQISGGDWVDVALRMVPDEDIDLIICGTHGPKGLKGLILGSMAEQLVAKATCSVWVVKPKGYPYLRD